DKQLGMAGRENQFAQRERLRELVGQMYGLSRDEIGICSCTSEAYNLASLALQLTEEDEVIINELDFPAGTTPWLQPHCAAGVKVWKAKGGCLRVEGLIPLLGRKTRLVTSSLVSFYNGFMINLPVLIEAVRKHSNALVALDVTQALGRVPLDLRGVDLIISSSYKWILGSHGSGLVGVPANGRDVWTVPAGGWFHIENPFGKDRFKRAGSRHGADSFGVGMPGFPAIYAVRAGLEYITDIGVDAIVRTAS
ncbi:unnamed protein product, partial [marine sediment metagenome]